MIALRVLVPAVSLSLAAVLAYPSIGAAENSSRERVVRGRVTIDDHAAAAQMLDHSCHFYEVQAGFGAPNAPKSDWCGKPEKSGSAPVIEDRAGDEDEGIENAPAGNAPGAAKTATRGTFYPTDVSYHGGAVMKSAIFHNVYVNCPTTTCWGNPSGFLTDLFASPFITVSNQYVNSTAANRYTVGAAANLTMSEYHLITDADVQAIVHAAAKALGGSGYTHVYHVYLPQGQDVCFDGTFSQCYSPDVPSKFVFCAYHASVTFSDVGHVVYSVEPYQNVAGCQVPASPAPPNGQLADSTNNVLSHETFELISDPDGNAWWDGQFNAYYGEEIGDLCAWVLYRQSLNGRTYETQLEYSDLSHACKSLP